MVRKTSPRKFLFFMSLVFLLVVGFSISTYYYILGRYTDQVVGLVESVLDGFTPEELESLINDEELLLALSEWQDSKNDLANILSENIDYIDINIESSDVISSGNSNSNSSNNSNTPNTGNNTENSNDLNPGGAADNGTQAPGDSSAANGGDNKDGNTNTQPANDTSPGTPSPNIPPELDQSLSNKLSAQDTVFILQVYRKFSSSEREELKRLHAEGGNMGLIKQKVEAKLSPAEIERSIEISLRILS